MAAKLTFKDVFNNELAGSKINFGSFTTALSVDYSFGSAPSFDASVGALYVDGSTGNVWRKTASGGSNWKLIASTSANIFVNQVRDIFSNTALTATGVQAPSLGDLVGLWGVGAWAGSGILSVSKYKISGMGSQNAGVAAGGDNAAGNAVTSNELFNGSTWAAGGAMPTAKDKMAGAGSQNAAFLAGGQTGAAADGDNLVKLFNGSAWASGSNLIANRQSAAPAGSLNAGLIAGGSTGNTDSSAIKIVELFNGTSWASSAVQISLSKELLAGLGSQNAALIAGGYTGNKIDTTNVVRTTEIFNGSTWSFGGLLSIAKQTVSGSGSQNAGFITGGQTSGGNATDLTELFNGSVWTSSGVLSLAKFNMAIAGGQNAGLAAGGIGNAATAIGVTELHSQTLYRKLYSRRIADSKKIGILINPNTVLLQGQSITTNFYPANKYLILNRTGVCSITNEADFSAGLAFASILGTAPTMTYNLSTTANLLQLVPGNMVVITGADLAVNNGTFVVSRVIHPSSIEIQNTNGLAANPDSGTLNFISSMRAVDTVSPQDIVVGTTDSNGILNIAKPIIAGSLTKRLK